MMNLSKVPDITEHHHLSDDTLAWIAQQNLWNLWVPEAFGGLECTLRQGLNTLQTLARIDGSLGWTVTLCAGANYFIGNLQPDFAAQLFDSKRVIMGGSGGISGHASKYAEGYRINGQWRYATGAPYLTHFTLNAHIVENGKVQTDAHGTKLFKSFVLPAEQVSVIEDWQTMGLKATATHSFEVCDQRVDDVQSFTYDEVYLPQAIYQMNFAVFADLTLWVNYIGMAEHLMAATGANKNADVWAQLHTAIQLANADVTRLASECEAMAGNNIEFCRSVISRVHTAACQSVTQLNRAVISLYPYLGIGAASESSVVNQIFRDYFTATQHNIFTSNVA